MKTRAKTPPPRSPHGAMRIEATRLFRAAYQAAHPQTPDQAKTTHPNKTTSNAARVHMLASLRDDQPKRQAPPAPHAPGVRALLHTAERAAREFASRSNSI